MTSTTTELANEERGHMTARDAKRSALGMGRILLGVIMAICVPVWLVFSLVDYTRPTVPANELVTPSVEVHDGELRADRWSSADRRPRWRCVHPSRPPRRLVDR